ncbi:Uncharacterised protein [Mycobacteroides abscessus subsp. abscessus]|nr:Uncharacterised protein [Mycobacteroides abscessus subsp. abscessus]
MIANHPSFRGDGKAAQQVCPAMRPVRTGETTWHLDCVLRSEHPGLHEDIRGRRWEATT